MRGPTGPTTPEPIPEWEIWFPPDEVKQPRDGREPPETWEGEAQPPEGTHHPDVNVDIGYDDWAEALDDEIEAPANVVIEKSASAFADVDIEETTLASANVVKWSDDPDSPAQRAVLSWWSELSREDPDIVEAIGVLKRGRDTIGLHPPSLTSPNTARKYAMWTRRMEAEGVDPDELALRYAKKTAYVIRAAYIDDVLSRRLPDALKAGRDAVRGMDPDALLEAAASVKEALGRLEMYPPDRNGDRIRRKAIDPESVESFYQAARRRARELGGPDLELAVANPNMSRRTILSRLPDGWRDRFWETAREADMPDHHKAPFAILRLLGCRPQEIEDGIMLEVSGKKLSITVLYPAKSHHEKYGLGTRTHTMRIIGSQANWLADYTLGHGGRIKISVPRWQLLRDARRISMDTFPGIRPPIVPYDFRHQYSADIKAMASHIFKDSPALREEWVAERMGHSSGKSQRSYGTASQGGLGDVEVDNVTLRDPSRKVKLSGERPLAVFKARAATPSV